MLCGFLDLRHDLNSRGPRADYAHSLPLPVDTFVPIRAVYELALEVVKTLDVRPFPII